MYHSKQSETITSAVIEAGSAPQYINKGEIEYQGIEVEGKISISETLLFTFNGSYQTSKADTGIKDDSFAPNEMVKAGFVYSYNNSLSVSAFNRYVGKSTDLNKTRGIPLNNQIPESYNLLTANFI